MPHSLSETLASAIEGLHLRLELVVSDRRATPRAVSDPRPTVIIKSHGALTGHRSNDDFVITLSGESGESTW